MFRHRSSRKTNASMFVFFAICLGVFYHLYASNIALHKKITIKDDRVVCFCFEIVKTRSQYNRLMHNIHDYSPKISAVNMFLLPFCSDATMPVHDILISTLHRLISNESVKNIL